ncbi:MAG: antitoxin [Chloroflexi bacterium]|nr:antitoxin [Chloroflexota bacterium]
MKVAKLFMNGNSQAVRLPKEFRFDGDRVYIKRVSNGVLLLPHEKSWQIMLDALDQFSDDIFEGGREQPAQQTRAELEEMFDELPS